MIPWALEFCTWAAARAPPWRAPHGDGRAPPSASAAHPRGPQLLLWRLRRVLSGPGFLLAVGASARRGGSCVSPRGSASLLVCGSGALFCCFCWFLLFSLRACVPSGLRLLGVFALVSCASQVPCFGFFHEMGTHHPGVTKGLAVHHLCVERGWQVYVDLRSLDRVSCF